MIKYLTLTYSDKKDFHRERIFVSVQENKNMLDCRFFAIEGGEIRNVTWEVATYILCKNNHPRNTTGQLRSGLSIRLQKSERSLIEGFKYIN